MVRVTKSKPVGRMTKIERQTKKRIEDKIKRLKNKRKGQTKGINLPEGWYTKAGRAHRFDKYLDSIRTSTYKLRSPAQKDKWRGDFSKDINY